ncbi:MAG TPA: cytochrome c [Geobacteraceae bacterium]
MTILYLKSILSIFMILGVLINVFTMFEAFGRNERRYDLARLKRVHRINGFIFILLYMFITWFCLHSVLSSQAELSPRATFHGVFALAVIVLLAMKIAFIEFYPQFSGKIMTIGPTVALLAFGMIGTSGGYYFLVTKLHTDTTFDEIMEYKEKGMKIVEPKAVGIKNDPESIGKGKKLFEAKCAFCHDPRRSKAGIGPGLSGVLRAARLPVSNKAATAENVRLQLLQPFSKMPSFAYLKEEEITDLLAYLNTL